MLSILVCHSYFLRFDQKQQERAKPYPPLATLQVASLLRNAGHEVALFDAMLADDLSRFERQLDVLKPQVVLLYEDNYNFLSKMCLSRMRAAACHMSEMARASGATVIASGSDVSDHPELYFAHGVQYALLGEGDHACITDFGRVRSFDCGMDAADDPTLFSKKTRMIVIRSSIAVMFKKSISGSRRFLRIAFRRAAL